MYEDGTSLISVVVPSCGRPLSVKRAVTSVLNQRLVGFELEVIVVDDGSTVPLAPFINKNFGHRIVCLKNEVSLGASAARNLGWKNSHGDFIAFLDDDDVWMPDKLSKQLECLKSMGSDCVLVGCSFSYMKDEVCISTKDAPVNKDLFERLMQSNVIGGCSVPLLRRSAFEKVNGFDETFESCQDWEVWLKLMREGGAGFVSDVLVHRQVHDGQMTSDLKRKIAGRERFISKFDLELSAHPSILAVHFRRLGTLNLIAGYRQIARDRFWKAIGRKANDWRSWIGIFLSLLPKQWCQKIAKKAGSTRIADVTFYH